MSEFKTPVRAVVFFFACCISTCVALAQGAKPTSNQIRLFPIFPSQPTRWLEVLSPINSEVLAVMNNRPVVTDQTSSFVREQSRAEPVLIQALECAQRLGSPKDIVQCGCNLGCFYYIANKYEKADKSFKSAINTARRVVPQGSPLLGPLLDYHAFALRALSSKYSTSAERFNALAQAEALYLEALQIRTQNSGYYSYDVAYTLSHLSYLYRDLSVDGLACPPSKAKDYASKAQQLEIEVDKLMNPRSRTNQLLMDKALQYYKEANLIWYSDPDKAWKLMDLARDYSDQSGQASEKLVLINTGERSDIVPNTIDLSRARPRPLSPYLPLNQGRAMLPDMLTYANSVIEKCKNQPKPLPARPPGLATIIGHWSVPTDITTRAEISTAQVTKETVEGVERRSGHAEHSSNLADVQIFLINASDYSEIDQCIQRFGKERGLSMDDLGKTWPANHQQAEALLLELRNVVKSICITSENTNKNGDYEIGPKIGKIPKGKYLLYAGLVTQRQVAIWVLPTDEDVIEVTRVQQFPINFTQSEAQILWTNQAR